MDLRILHILAHERQEDLYLLWFPAEANLEQLEGEGFQALEDIRVGKRADFFHVRVFGPDSDRYGEFSVHNVGEASVFDPAFEFDAGAGLAAEFAGGFDPEFVPFVEVGVVYGAILRVVEEVVVLKFDLAAWFGVPGLILLMGLFRRFFVVRRGLRTQGLLAAVTRVEERKRRLNL
jgi:hypothetical protein